MNILPSHGPVKAKLNATYNNTTNEWEGTELDKTCRPIVQNVGPGDLYIGGKEVATGDLIAHGLLLTAGCVYELPSVLLNGLVELWIQADNGTGITPTNTSCEVRILNVG